jgi:hypothetical protein
MNSNDLLEAKYKVQKTLSEQAGHDMAEYARLSRQITQEIELKYGMQFRYGSPALQSDSDNFRCPASPD